VLREWISSLLREHLPSESDDALLSWRSAGDENKVRAIECLLNGVSVLVRSVSLEFECSLRRQRNDDRNSNRAPAHLDIPARPIPDAEFVERVLNMVDAKLGDRRAAFVANPCFHLTACSAWQRFMNGVRDIGRLLHIQVDHHWVLSNTRIVFHGSCLEGVQRISCRGFDVARRAGQSYGAGEYFGLEPNVSAAYAKIDAMLVCLALNDDVDPMRRLRVPDSSRDMLVINNPLEDLTSTFVAPIGLFYHNTVPGTAARDAGEFDCDFPLPDETTSAAIRRLTAYLVATLKDAIHYGCSDPQHLDKLETIMLPEHAKALEDAAKVAFPTRGEARAYSRPSAWSPLGATGMEYLLAPTTPAVDVDDEGSSPQLQWYVCTKHRESMRVVLHKAREPCCPLCNDAQQV
jgi:hypothetical protein